MSAFEFLQVPARLAKPRDAGLTAMNDFGLSLRQIEDILQTAEDVIDLAKYKDHAGEIYRYSREFLSAKNALYRRYGVRTYMGGAPFEVAYLQDQTEPYVDRLVALGFDYVKISNYDMPELERAERTRLVRRAAEQLGVITVVLRPVRTGAANTAWAIREALEDVAAGASFVTLDQNEARLWRQHEPAALQEFAGAVGLGRILFEVGAGVEPAWFIRELGIGVNLENINVTYPNGATSLELLRRGLHRELDYPFIRVHGGQVAPVRPHFAR